MHANSELRDAFQETVSLLMDEPVTLETRVADGEFTVARLIGKLWNCTDCLPRSAFDDLAEAGVLEADRPQSYAVAVRALKAYLDEGTTE
jgi:hypothetical protein